MIRSKINPSTVQDLSWKDYAKLFEKDIKQAQDKSLAKVPLIMVSDFKFACGEVHALILLGKQSEMTKKFKDLKMDPERKKLKDFSIGFCHFDKEENGSYSIRIAIEGFGKPNKMKKNSKKLLKKLGVNLKDIIKGQYTDEVVQQIEEDNVSLTKEELQQQQQMSVEATSMKEEDDKANDNQNVGEIAKEFISANQEMTANVIALLKIANSEPVTYTKEHIEIAEKAFRAAASLVDKCQELEQQGVDLEKSAKKVQALRLSIEKNGLVKKYETIWKKVSQEYNKQVTEISTELQAKMDQFEQLMKEIDEELN
ncbi:MAG: hypothetical protein AB8E82_16090 [Aureispira sp.]